MFDIGFSELLVIGIVALIVVGPKDLPGMFHTLGRFTARARQLAREFSRAMESAADDAGVKDVAKDLRDVTSPKSMGLDALKDAADKFESWKPGQSGGGSAGPGDKGGLSEDRAEMAKTIHDATAAKAQARLDAEAAAEAASWEEEDKQPAAKPAAKKPAAKKPAAKKPAASKPAAKKTAAAKAPAKKPAAKKPAAPRKTAAKKAAAPDGDA